MVLPLFHNGPLQRLGTLEQQHVCAPCTLVSLGAIPAHALHHLLLSAILVTPIKYGFYKN